MARSVEFRMSAKYTAVIQYRDPWWIGWIEEIRGVNSQGATREELLANLESALQEALEMNRSEALAECQGPFEEVSIQA
jgi:predicted RNase H-like HicB family nuclease